MAASTAAPHDPTNTTSESYVRRLEIMRPLGVQEVRGRPMPLRFALVVMHI
jgi:hypothetical protein